MNPGNKILFLEARVTSRHGAFRANHPTYLRTDQSHCASVPPWPHLTLTCIFEFVVQHVRVAIRMKRFRLWVASRATTLQLPTARSKNSNSPPQISHDTWKFEPPKRDRLQVNAKDLCRREEELRGYDRTFRSLNSSYNFRVRLENLHN